MSENANGPRLADHTTPFIRNEWYVAALSSEIDSTSFSRKILGVGVLMYRTSGNTVVAMRNRCPHRSFPLSSGKRDGDKVICGYHGMTFGPDGRCVEVPSQSATSRELDNRSFPIIERPPFVWIWMGDPAKAESTTIPEHPWLAASDYAAFCGYMHCRTNYVRLHENVLDLTHFPYVHSPALGDRDYIEAPAKVRRDGLSVSILRTLKRAPVNPLFGGIIGITGHMCDRTSDSRFETPGFHIAHSIVKDLDGGIDGRNEFNQKIIHCFTPESEHSTHYFFANARDFRISDLDLTNRMENIARSTFAEDEEALEKVEQTWVDEEGGEYEERSVRGDVAGLHMRRIIAERAGAELEGR